MSHLNPETLLFSLKMTCILDGVWAAVFAFAVPLNVYRSWVFTRSTTVTLPCQDREQALGRAVEVFQFTGTLPVPNADGSFIFEAGTQRSTWVRTTALVDFSQPGLVSMTGGATYLKSLAKAEKVPLLPTPGYPSFGRLCFRSYRPHLWWMGFMFVIIFVAGVIGDPQHSVNPHPGPDPHVFHPSH